MVDVPWLGETDDWVDENVGQVRSGSSNSQLSVSAVHWVSGLEGNDTVPSKLLEVESQLCWGISESDIVVVLQSVDGLDLSTNVKLLSSGV